MTDPTALQASLDAQRDILQLEIARATRKLTAKVRALEVELAAANASLEHFRRSKTEPAPPMTAEVA